MTPAILNTPSCLIPKELFKEEKITTYWSALYNTNYEYFGKDEMDHFILLYPKLKDEDTIHEITFMYQNFCEKYADKPQVICFNIDDDGVDLLALKEQQTEYTGFFAFTTKEDLLYHLANISQQIFGTTTVDFYYRQAPAQLLSFLNNYYEIKPL
jgi:hypothetical protein